MINGKLIHYPICEYIKCRDIDLYNFNCRYIFVYIQARNCIQNTIFIFVKKRDLYNLNRI